MTKVGIFDPYLDTLGGGERYCLTLAEILSLKGLEVDLFWSGDPAILTKAQARFHLDLSRVNLVPNIFIYTNRTIEHAPDSQALKIAALHHQPRPSLLTKFGQFFKKVAVTSRYDYFFYLTDWSIPFLFSKNNYLHAQLPLLINPDPKTKLLNKIKLTLHKKIICNSEFTAGYSRRFFGPKTVVIYPPVDISQFSAAANRENIILSVGRFDNIMNSKKQDLLIEQFKILSANPAAKNWQLILAGGSLEDPEKNAYLRHLRSLSSGLAVEIVVNPPFDRLKALYSRSKIYWHAAGYGVDQDTHPEFTEHFGMAPVEAMASGVVPLLVNKGGLPEILTDGADGFFWSTPGELVAKTLDLISHPGRLSSLSAAAIKSSSRFSKSAFADRIFSLFNIS